MNRVEKVIAKLTPPFGGSLPLLSEALGVHRSTLHHAKRRNVLSPRLQAAIMFLAKKYNIDLDASEIINV